MGKIQNQLQKQQGKTLRDLVADMKPAIDAALPSVMTPERFARITLSALSSNPKLMECTPESFLAAMMGAAQLGVEVNTNLGQGYLIPYRNKGVMECQFQLGYKGLIDLAYRSGEVSSIQAHTVHERDVFEYELGLEPKLRHVPAKTDRGEPVYFYAVFRLKSGGYGFEVMSVEDVRAHAQRYSKAYGSGPWQTDFEAMAKKTVLKKALKYAPMRSDFVRGLATDEAGADLSDLREVPTVHVEDYDADVIEVDAETGEVKEETGAR